jgi:hypothetical protein
VAGQGRAGQVEGEKGNALNSSHIISWGIED